MRIGLVSADCKTSDLEYKLNQINTCAKQNGGKLEVICFGEAYLNGFNGLTWLPDQDKKIALKQNSEVILRLRKIAKENSVAISTGYHEYFNEQIFSSNIFIDRDGEIIDNYRRVSIGWKDLNKLEDKSCYCEGNGFHIFMYEEIKFAVAICGDLWYDEFVEEMKNINADFVLWPLCIDYTPDEWQKAQFEYAQQVKSINCPVLMINYCDPVSNSQGGCAVFHSGKILSSLVVGEKGILVYKTK